MRQLSIPSDFRTETIDRYAELNQRYEAAAVVETYGQATVGVMAGSGRNSRLLPTTTLDALAQYAAYSAARGIEFNYTLNASCLGNIEFTEAGIRKINRFLGDLWHLGIRHLTVTLPQLMTIVRDSGHGFTVKASTICQINSVRKANFYKAQGADRLVIDEDITRDFRKIRLICDAFGDGVEMIVNSVCIKDCPYKMFHYNHESHYSFGKQDVRSFFSQRCAVQRASELENVIHLNWVRPEDLHYYESIGVRRFKIQGRHSVLHGDPVAAAEAYMRGSYDGNLYELLHLFDARRKSDTYYPNIDNAKLARFLAPFFEDPDHCSGDCAACRYCDGFARQAMNAEKSEADMNAAKIKLAGEEPFSSLHKQSLAARMSQRLARKAYTVVTRKK